MKDVIYPLLHDHLYLHVVLISICVAGIIVAMGVDLFFGIRKAKALGHATTSTGYKKTCEKGRKYFMPFAVLMMIDIIACIILPAPFFVMIWSAWCIFCEFKSVREKSWTKAELRRAEKTMSIIIENKDDIAKMVADMVLGGSREASPLTFDEPADAVFPAASLSRHSALPAASLSGHSTENRKGEVATEEAHEEEERILFSNIVNGE